MEFRRVLFRSATGVLVGPKPLAYSTTVSPGLGGVVNPGYKVAGPRRLPLASACSAATYGTPLKTKNDGESGCAATLTAVLVVPALVSVTGTWPCIDRKSTRLNSSHLVISYA